jgi:hypothetical protein
MIILCYTGEPGVAILIGVHISSPEFKYGRNETLNHVRDKRFGKNRPPASV